MQIYSGIYEHAQAKLKASYANTNCIHNRDYLLIPPTQPLSDTDVNTTNDISTPDIICHRTSCVLRLLILPPARWRRYILGLDPSDGADEQGEVDALLGEILRELKAEVERTMEVLEATQANSGPGAEKEGEDEDEVAVEVQRKEACKTLLDRWRRIGEVVDWALGELGRQ